jgi:hypothetical protein
VGARYPANEVGGPRIVIDDHFRGEDAKFDHFIDFLLFGIA